MIVSETNDTGEGIEWQLKLPD